MATTNHTRFLIDYLKCFKAFEGYTFDQNQIWNESFVAYCESDLVIQLFHHNQLFLPQFEDVNDVFHIMASYQESLKFETFVNSGNFVGQKRLGRFKLRRKIAYDDNFPDCFWNLQDLELKLSLSVFENGYMLRVERLYGIDFHQTTVRDSTLFSKTSRIPHPISFIPKEQVIYNDIDYWECLLKIHTKKRSHYDNYNESYPSIDMDSRIEISPTKKYPKMSRKANELAHKTYSSVSEVKPTEFQMSWLDDYDEEEANREYEDDQLWMEEQLNKLDDDTAQELCDKVTKLLHQEPTDYQMDSREDTPDDYVKWLWNACASLPTYHEKFLFWYTQMCVTGIVGFDSNSYANFFDLGVHPVLPFTFFVFVISSICTNGFDKVFPEVEPSFYQMDESSSSKYEMNLFGITTTVKPDEIMMESFEDAVETVEGLTKAVRGLPGEFKEAIRECGSTAQKSVRHKSGMALGLVTVCAGIDYAFNGRESSKYLAIGSAVATAAAFGPEIVHFVTNVLLETSGTDYQMDSIPGICRTALEYLIDCLPIVEMRKLKDYIYLITNFTKVKEGLQGVVNWVLESIDFLVLKFSGATIIPSSWYRSVATEKELINFVTRVKEFTDDIAYGATPVNINTYNILKDLIAECLVLRTASARGSGAASVLDTTYRGLDILAKKFGGVSHGCTANRVEPVCIGLAGGTGVNKSTVADMIMQAIILTTPETTTDPRQYVIPNSIKASSKQLKISPNEKIYVKPLSSDFWDGYLNQLITFMDEFGQTIDVAGMKDNPYLTFIGMINTIPFNLPMADLPDKGTTYFTSDYVVYTTNCRTFQPNGVVDKSAIDRRTHVNIVVCPKAKYCKQGQEGNDVWNRQFDYERFGIDNVVELKPEMFEFHRRTMNRERSEVEITSVLTFEEVMCEIVKTRLRNCRIKEENDRSAKEFAITHKVRYEALMRGEVSVGCLNDLKGDYKQYTKFLFTLQNRYGTLFIDYNLLIEQLLDKYGLEFEEGILYDKDYSHWALVATQFCPKLEVPEKALTILQHTTAPKSLIEKMKIFMVEYKEYILAAGAIGGVWYTGNMLMKEASKSKESDYQSPTMVRPAQKSNIKSMAELHKAYARSTNFQMGAGEDPNGDAWSDSVLRNNCYSMVIGERHKGQIVFFHSTLAIVPSHFLKWIDLWMGEEENPLHGNTPITFKCGQDLSKAHTHFNVTAREFLEGYVHMEDLEGSELAIVKFPIRVGAKPNIVKNFKSVIEMKEVFNQVVLKMAFHGSNGVTIDSQRGRAVRIFNHPINEIDKTINLLKVGYEEKFLTNPGHCGAILVEMNPKSLKKFIGIHVSGSPKHHQAITAPVYKEWLEMAIDHCNRCELLVSDTIMDNVHINGRIVGEETISSYQMGVKFPDNPVVGEGKPIAQMSKTTWKRSNMCGLFQEPTMAPALLHPKWVNGVLIDPKEIALEGYGGMSGYVIDSEVLDMLMQSEVDWYNSTRLEYVEPREFTLREAICGLIDDVDSGPLSRKSSPGYPYVHVKTGTKGKVKWFGDNPDFEFESEAFKIFEEKIYKDRKLLSTGTLPEFVFVTNLKDELRKWAKLAKFATRNFSASSMDLTVLFGMSFGAMLVDFIKNRVSNGGTIGINPYSPEWDLLGRLLTSLDDVVNAGDFEAFDKKHIPQIVVAGFALVDDFYKNQTAEERAIRWTLWTTLWRTNELVGNLIYLWLSSLPSGHKLTAFWNSLYNRICHKFAFHQNYIEYQDKGLIEDETKEELAMTNFEMNQRYSLNREAYRRCYEAFWIFNKEVVLFTHGDDSVGSCTPRLREIFNENVLKKPMRILGQNYTAEDKLETDRTRKRKISEISFLKRYWRWEPVIGGYVAPMKLERVLEMINWTRVVDGDSILRDKCYVVARELTLHGKNIAVPLIKKLNGAHIREFGVGMDKTSFTLLFMETCSSEVLPFVSDFQMNMTPVSSNKREALSDNFAVAEPTNNMQKSISMAQNATYYQMETVTSVDVKPSAPADLIYNDDPEAVVIAKGPPVPTKSMRFSGDISNDNEFFDIKRALERPVLIIQSTFLSTDTPSTFLKYEWTAPSQHVLNLNKLSGVGLFKADLVIDLVVNASPFSQGLYSLGFLYSGGPGTDFGPIANWNRMHGFSKTQISQLPCVYVNLGCDTKVTLRIPWKSVFHGVVPSSFAPNKTTPGSFFLYPFVPFATGAGGTQSASYSIFAHYENIELGFATYPQMDLIEKEADNGSKKVSARLRSLGQIARNFGKIPVLSSISGPVSNVLDASSMLAASLGFSKPAYTEHSTKVVRIYNPSMGISDGVDTAEYLAITGRNHVALASDLTGSNLDEMSIDFIKAVPTWFTTFTLSTADTYNLNKYSTRITPLGFISVPVSDSALTNVINMTTLWFLAANATYWRGSIVVRGRIAKTKFHSGRYMVYVNFQDNVLTSTDPQIVDSPYVYREILDIRETDEFEIVIPYVKKAPWCECGKIGASIPDIGSFYIRCLDPLAAPASVSSTVSVVLEVQGGKDFAVSSPRPFPYQPMIPSAYQMDGSEEGCVLATLPIGGMSVIDQTDDAREVTQGEAYTSLRLSLKRFSPYVCTTQLAATGNTYFIPVFASYWLQSNGTITIQGTSSNITVDAFSLFSSIFAFSRGGARICLIPNGSSSIQVMNVAAIRGDSGLAAIATLPSSSAQTISSFYFRYGLNPNSYFLANTPATYAIPQNSAILHRCSSANFLTTTSSLNMGYEATDGGLLLANQNGSSPISFSILRSGADDCTFSLFVSLPPFYALAAPA